MRARSISRVPDTRHPTPDVKETITPCFHTHTNQSNQSNEPTSRTVATKHARTHPSTRHRMNARVMPTRRTKGRRSIDRSIESILSAKYFKIFLHCLHIQIQTKTPFFQRIFRKSQSPSHVSPFTTRLFGVKSPSPLKVPHPFFEPVVRKRVVTHRR